MGMHPVWLQHETVRRNWPSVKTRVPVIYRLDQLFDLDGLFRVDENRKAFQKKMKTVAKIRQVWELYTGNAFSFVKEAITLPNGRDTEMAMIRHPGSTAIVALSDDNTVVMTHQYRHAIRDYILEVPAGTLDPGETFMECARRELEEETGFKAGKMTVLSQIYILPAYSDEKIHLYLATDPYHVRTASGCGRDYPCQKISFAGACPND